MKLPCGCSSYIRNNQFVFRLCKKHTDNGFVEKTGPISISYQKMVSNEYR